MLGIGRRGVIALLGSAARFAILSRLGRDGERFRGPLRDRRGPLAARAQQPAKLRTIGFFGSDASVWRPWTEAFVARLRELGWIEGSTIAIEYRWGEGRPDQHTEIAAEFVRRKADVIVATAPAFTALKQVTSAIPIVFVLAQDPVGGGLVGSLARPGGNVTGLSVQQTDPEQCPGPYSSRRPCTPYL
jgi:hypothetical protein